MNDIDAMQWIATLVMARCGIEAFGRQLRMEREGADVSLRQLAEMIDVRADILTRIEKGTWVPSAEDARKIIYWMGEPF